MSTLKITIKAPLDLEEISQNVVQFLNKSLHKPKWQELLISYSDKHLDGLLLVHDEEASSKNKLVFNLKKKRVRSTTNYFWTDDEHLQFMRLVDQNGKNYKKISQQMNNRTHQQVRTHAQKYNTSLNSFLLEVQKASMDSSNLQSEFYPRLNKYLAEKTALLKFANEVTKEVFPNFIYSKQDISSMSFEDQMQQVAKSIKFELSQ